jgi:hypothetical protein
MAVSLKDEGDDSNELSNGLPLISPGPAKEKKGLESVRINSILTLPDCRNVTAP